MATKKEILEATTSAAMALCDTHNVSDDFRNGLTAILNDNLAPKSSGAKVNVDEVTHKDAEGNITEIQCSVSGVWLPATVEYFYEDKKGEGLAGTGLKRLSRQAEAIRKQHIKVISATERAIMADVLDGALTPEDGKARLEEAKAQKPDYSSVAA